MRSRARGILRLLAGCAACAALAAVSAGAIAATGPAPLRPEGVVLILIPGLTFADIQQLPALKSLASRGSVALMSTRTGRAYQTAFGETLADPLASGYLTMAAGARAAGGPETGAVFPVREHSRTGRWRGYNHSALPDAGLAAPWMGAAATQALAAPYEITIGTLGQALRDRGITVEVVGVADTPQEAHREAALFAAGRDGLAPGATLWDGVERDSRYPFGVRTPVPELCARLRQAAGRARFVVVETGDPARYERCKADALPEARARLRRLAMDSADAIVREGADTLPKGSMLVVTSPGQASDPDAPGADRLAPLLVLGSGAPRGLLTSGSTRKPGVVANTDVSASLALWLGAGDAAGTELAREIGVVARPEPTRVLSKIYEAAAYQDRTQRVLYVFTYGACAIILLACVALPGAARTARLAPSLALAPPAAFLAILALTHQQPQAAILGLAMAAAGLGWAAGTFVLRQRASGEVLAALSTAAVAAALLAGILPLAAGSYTIQGGARYYGIGNEYGGFFVGAACYLAGGAFVERHRWRRYAGLAALTAAALFCGHPDLGANAGVMLGALAGCTAYAVLMLPEGNRGKAVAIIAVAAALAAGIAAADALRPTSSQSHLGRAVNAIARQGPEAAVQIIARKGEMNLMLLQRSPWSLLLGVSAAGALLAGHVARRRQTPANRLRQGALWAATLALLVLNDSGVLAGASCGIWLFASGAGEAGVRPEPSC